MSSGKSHGNGPGDASALGGAPSTTDWFDDDPELLDVILAKKQCMQLMATYIWLIIGHPLGAPGTVCFGSFAFIFLARK